MPVRAQFLPREASGGAVFGGLLGGIIGHNNGRRTAEGIAIGAGAGLLLGTWAGYSRRDREHYYAASTSYGYWTPSYLYAYPPYPASYVAVSPAVPAPTPGQDAQGNSGTAESRANPTPVQPRGSSSMAGANQLFGR